MVLPPKQEEQRNTRKKKVEDGIKDDNMVVGVRQKDKLNNKS